MDEALLSRIEDAGLNASAPPQQRWIDGWIVRCSPGKARRARCINAVSPGRLPLDQRLSLAAAAYAAAGLPMLLRITPYSLPRDLEPSLLARGWTKLDEAQVMVVSPQLEAPDPDALTLPPRTHWLPLAAAAFAEAVGGLRGSPSTQRLAHAQRLLASPVPYHGFAVCSDSDGAVLACGQYAQEAEIIGLYDIMTRESARGTGLATVLCRRLLSLAAINGADVAYLQVEVGNKTAHRIYERLGFQDAYRYGYLAPP